MKKELCLIIFLCLSINAFPTHFKHIGMSEGLSQTSVMSIHQDILGRMWFGTREGITIYDGVNTTVYKPWSDPESKHPMETLYGNECDFITSNEKGDIFFRSNNSLMRYDIHNEQFNIIRTNNVRTLTSHEGTIWCVVEDSLFTYNSLTDSLQFQAKTNINTIFTIFVAYYDKIWLGASDGLYLLENNSEIKTVIPEKEIFSIFESSKNELWIGTRMDGLYRIHLDGTTTVYLSDNPPKTRIGSNHIREFVEDSHGNIWFGTFKGLHKFNTYTEEISYYTRNNLPGGLSHSSVFSLYLDRQGTIWIGTYYGGVNYFNPERDIFSHYVDNPNRNDCLNYPFVGKMVEDKDGNIWICTEGGGLNMLNRKTQTFKYFVSGDKNGPPHDNLKSISYDEQNDMLYIGTHTGGLTRFHIPSQKFHNYISNNEVPSTRELGEIIIHTEIYNNHLFISSRNGLFRMNLDTEEFTYLQLFCINFTIDSNGWLWFLYLGNLTRLNTNNLSEIQVIPLRERGVRFDATRLIEYNGKIYFGTNGSGFYMYDYTEDSLKAYTVSSAQLLSNYCYNIALTKAGIFVITGDKGVTFFNPEKESSHFVELGKTLPISSITEGCGVLICEDDEIYVGGSDGLTSFWEAGLYLEKRDYNLYFSNIFIHNKQVRPEDDTNILTEALSFTEKIKLDYNQNNIIVNFASNNYIDIHRNYEYEYMLEGFDAGWNPTSLYSIHYTNLNPGKYNLRLRERDLSQNTSPANEVSLLIHITKPWYNTVLAWIIYLSIISSILIFIIHARKSRRALALTLEKEQEEKKQNEIQTQAKLRFFTNISHEFRVPLTLIISQIDLLTQSSTLTPTVHNKIQKISNNASRMKMLINELLEFRKLEQNYTSLHVHERDLNIFINDIFISFNELAIQKRINYNILISDKPILLWFDTYQLQKVFYNIISNAFKYTNDGGEINVAVKEEDGFASVQIIDNGIGLSTEDSKKIFDLFYQAENSFSVPHVKPGTGIGLSLSQQIVKLHYGEINVQSKIGYGTVFSVKLLKGKDHFVKNDKVVISDKQEEEESLDLNILHTQLTKEDYEEIASTAPDFDNGKKHTVLIVDDNKELLSVLHSLFSPLYRVLLANDGKEGLEVAIKEIPDLIVSDLKMPRMSGTEMCSLIKNNINLSHIPVVLLTALGGVEHEIEGYQQGADAYIEKPFNSKTLLIRCNNIIRNRILMQRKFDEQPDMELATLAINPLDQNLLERVSKVVENNFSNSEFDVDILAKEAGISRSSLFTKFKALTGITPNEFIRTKRLNQAALLLKTHPELLVIEIAEQVGFSSAVYFSRIFKSKYGVSPSQYRN